MSLNFMGVPKRELTDDEARALTADELLNAPAQLYHDYDAKTVTGENAEGRELVRRLRLYDEGKL